MSDAEFGFDTWRLSEPDNDLVEPVTVGTTAMDGASGTKEVFVIGGAIGTVAGPAAEGEMNAELIGGAIGIVLTAATGESDGDDTDECDCDDGERVGEETKVGADGEVGEVR